MGGRAAQLGGLVVHHRNKVGHTARAHIVGHDIGGLVGAGQHHRIQKLPHGHGLAAADIRSRGVAPVKIIVNIARRSAAYFVQLVLILVQHKAHRHQLGQAGGRKPLFAVVLIHDQIGVQVHDISRRSMHFIAGLIAHSLGGQRPQRKRKQQGAKAGR